MRSVSHIPISVQQHETLHTSKGVITCGRLLNIPVEEITQELSGQSVKDVRRINSRRDGVSCASVLATPKPTARYTCARCAVAGHESTGCTAVEKCVNCQGKHTSFSRSCPKWKQEKEVVATKYQNNISFPEARRLVKAQTPPDGKSYAYVVDKNHPVYQTTHCPDCNHVVTMSNFLSTSKSPKPVAISSSGTENRKILPEPISQTCEAGGTSQDSSGFKLKDLPAKLKKSSHHNSVALGLAERGIVHKDLPSIFCGVPQVPDLKLHPSDEDEEHSASFDIANTLGHAFSKVSATDSYSPDFVAIKNRAERTPLRLVARSTLPYNSEFRMFELETVLSRAHDTSPGLDGITYNMLRHLNTTSLSHLLFLFNRIWTEQKYPFQWHEAIVIPILKPGKDPSNPLHYRPIALTSCLCKTFERMVNARLVFEL
ncbi:hypothetical protein AVEN_19982-1 [Araneus ventricosus]|uniref:RNA-directed DNA polymerase from transposon X-element n=1 Tax=Araneus ventricosus TaxID=182803 RepID=A0A4Y2R8M7_ARAVE|nr:hypothetical protein AVEN_19982-1 [Araneus ventricosus]